MVVTRTIFMLGYSGDPTRRAHVLGPRSLDGDKWDEEGEQSITHMLHGAGIFTLW